ncbi:ABC transporter ATP-binding protein [Eubacterium ramulus]|uniref:ABC transporter ATP-binding protein n=1 Tax=Eubacterium ramulus TaxID=39490 RepID=UPI003520E472
MRDLLFRSLKDIRRIAPRSLIMQVICMMLQSVLVAVNTWLVSVFLNHVYTKDLKTSMIYLGVIWGVFVASEVSNSVFYACMVKIDSKIGMQLGIELGEKGGRLSLIQYEDVEINNRLKRAQDCIEHGRFSDLSLSVFNILAEVLKVGSTLFILARFSPLLALVSLLSVVPYFVVRLIRGKEFYELKKYQAAGERRRNYLYDLFGDKRVVKELRIFGIESYIEEKLYQTRDAMNQELWDFKKRDICSFLLCEILCKCGYVLSIIIAILLLLNHRLDFGMLAASLVAFTSFQLAAKYFLISLGRIPECAAFVRDYYDFIDIDEDVHGTEKFEPNFDKINVKNVCFAYPNTDHLTISDISLDIKKNESIAIVGNNGSGKTTLVKLLTDLYKVQEGEILYGTQNIKDLETKEFYQNVSIVSQDFVKYEMTLQENIGISDWKQMGNTDKIQELLKQMDLPELSEVDALNTLLGSEFDGRDLSIGQWQKLAIARGMFKESSMIVLDEPTAALDPIMETTILKMFLQIAKEKTAIIVSHRIGICREVDKIIVMKKGKVVEIGNHDELLAKKGEYYQLYKMQQKWYVE